MIALVASTLLPALFVTSGMFGAVVLLGTWNRYGAAYRRLNAELATCAAVRPVMITISSQAARLPLGPVRPARRSLRTLAQARPAIAPARSVAA